MTNKRLSAEQERELRIRVTSGPWAAWVSTARAVDVDTLERSEFSLARALGIPIVPKGGVLSFGWCVNKLTIGHGSPSPDSANQIVRVVAELSPHGPHGQRISPTAEMVYSLMYHRAALEQHDYNFFHYYASPGVKLFTDTWTQLNEDVLGWFKLQSPFSNLEGGDEFLERCCMQDGRLHCGDGPAVRTSKGRELYALRGVIIPYDDYQLRGRARQILEVRNVEVRRVLIEDMGAERFIKESGLDPIHKDETGSLYRLDSTTEGWNRNRTHLCWVHVTCSSTGRQYMLAVPPMTRTAREGVAWTFRKLPEEYHPQQET